MNQIQRLYDRMNALLKLKMISYSNNNKTGTQSSKVNYPYHMILLLTTSAAAVLPALKLLSEFLYLNLDEQERFASSKTK